ncbi:Splicing factor 3B subunit 4 [Seminavis robusta]|uniref:Splicing factor 3B subunit 4 n=1 Tax=Seminavis robusta TaxID=568900 RepID=A0A9N8EYY3_9STRA|nr:Splicing factor 3B subunit 4 [Seminavis robusta]|eukprot:Sro2184_g318070.1 Splicing factor 3B subunit 4 (359) ;mRNA; f:622-1807
MPEEQQPDHDWDKVILSSLKKETKKGEETVDVKQLRKRVLQNLELDESDKKGKKAFKKAMKGLEQQECLTIDANGVVSYLKKKKEDKKDKKRKKKEEKKERKKKKQKREEPEKEEDAPEEDNDEDSKEQQGNEEEEQQHDNEPENQETQNSQKGVPCPGNPGGVTRLFLGNLPFAVDETSLSEFLPNAVTHIKWITDKETGKFYGSAFIEMDTPSAAAKAVEQTTGSKLMGRPVKINFAPARPGDVWPPANKVISGNGNAKGGQAGGSGVQAMGAKPDNCVKLFIGNLSYDIDDDAITKFFDNAGAEVKAVRWLSHKETGDFKGCGFVEFWNSEACDKAATLNGKNLLGRPIRIDWTD